MKKLAALLTLCLITISCEPVMGDKFDFFFESGSASNDFDATVEGGSYTLTKNSAPINSLIIDEWASSPKEYFSFGDCNEDNLLGTFSGNWCEVTINKNDVIVVVEPNDTSINRRAYIRFFGKLISADAVFTMGDITVNQAAKK